MKLKCDDDFYDEDVEDDEGVGEVCVYCVNYVLVNVQEYEVVCLLL